MTPKELDFLYKLIEDATKAAYTIGHEDGTARKSLNTEQFKLTPGNKLVLKKELNSFTKKH